MLLGRKVPCTRKLTFGQLYVQTPLMIRPSNCPATVSQVPDPLGRRRNESRGGARASRSLMEGSFREDVGSGAQAGVMGWFSSAERMEANRVSIEIEIAADQTMRPQTVYVKATAEKADRSTLRGAADEDHQTARMSLEILTPTNGKGASRRSR